MNIYSFVGAVFLFLSVAEFVEGEKLRGSLWGVAFIGIALWMAVY